MPSKDSTSLQADPGPLSGLATKKRLERAAPDLLAALKLILSDPVIGGISARIRDCAKQESRPNPLAEVRAAIAKAGG